MRGLLKAFLALAAVLAVVGCPGPGGGPTPNRGGSVTSTGGMEYVFTPNMAYSGLGDPYLYLFGLAHGKNTYVAVGNYGTVLTSSNGTDWYVTENNYNNRSLVRPKHTAPAVPGRARTFGGAGATVGHGTVGRAIPTGRALIDEGYDADIWDDLIGVAFGADKFVAVGYGGSAWSSADGTNWAQIGGVSFYNFYSIAFLNGKFVAFGYDGDYYMALTSSDGSSWTPYELPTYDFYAGAAYGNGVYVAVTYGYGGSPICTSSDGNSWTEVPYGNFSLPESFYSEGFNIMLTSVAFHDGVFVAVGTAEDYYSYRNIPLVLVSTDGANWSSQDLPDLTPYGLGGDDGVLAGVAATDLGFIAVGDFYSEGVDASFVMASTTGRSWQHDYYSSSLSGGVVSGNGLSAVGQGQALFDWWPN